MRITSSPFISALKLQPTPQYAQVVVTECSGVPASITVFSIKVAVGHAATQAPHDTHSESLKFSMPDATLDSKPRPEMVNA